MRPARREVNFIHTANFIHLFWGGIWTGYVVCKLFTVSYWILGCSCKVPIFVILDLVPLYIKCEMLVFYKPLVSEQDLSNIQDSRVIKYNLWKYHLVHAVFPSHRPDKPAGYPCVTVWSVRCRTHRESDLIDYIIDVRTTMRHRAQLRIAAKNEQFEGGICLNLKIFIGPKPLVECGFQITIFMYRANIRNRCGFSAQN